MSGLSRDEQEVVISMGGLVEEVKVGSTALVVQDINVQCVFSLNVLYG